MSWEHNPPLDISDSSLQYWLILILHPDSGPNQNLINSSLCYDLDSLKITLKCIHFPRYLTCRKTGEQTDKSWQKVISKAMVILRSFCGEKMKSMLSADVQHCNIQQITNNLIFERFLKSWEKCVIQRQNKMSLNHRKKSTMTQRKPD